MKKNLPIRNGNGALSAILKRMDQSARTWRGNTDSVRDKLIKVLEWLNPAEAEKAIQMLHK